MVNYQKEVENDAKMFIRDHEDEIKQRLLDGNDVDDDNSSDGWDFHDALHYDVTDRGYTITDAAFVIENSNNVESDSCLWDGQDADDAIRTMAAYTYSNDVRSEIVDICKQIKEEFESEVDGMEFPEDADEDEEKGKILQRIMDETLKDEVEPVEQGSDEEKRLLQKWLSMGNNAGLWSGYPLGSSYIDARCGTGYGMPEIADYVNFDHEVASKVPHLSGKYRESIIQYLTDTFGVYPDKYCGEILKIEKFIVERLIKEDRYDKKNHKWKFVVSKPTAKEAGDYIKTIKKRTVKYRIVRDTRRKDVLTEVEPDKKASQITA